ncbi:MAG: tRNA pseudouridine(38-40) synthase TruA [Verrucomicrobia bacterium]|nr:tRNA pseudouridine(38-40) synthase TruA [Verrucomicrobiota bacterium]MDA1066807.1 tRNA pseudouridine(38-40) synthase TruA [Verrucomicrobiota bacterium]
MNRWKCLCAYDGTDFAGWQTQPTLDAVQDVIEAALSKLLKISIRIHGSGRTDAGVHALGQVFHFDADWKHDSSVLLKAINTHLPKSIQILSVTDIFPEFHARYSAQGKCYQYQIYLGHAGPFETRYWLSVPYALDVDLISKTGQCLLGQHDFSAFAAELGKENPVKEFRRFDASLVGNHLTLIFEASGFMYKMVRSLTGALLKVGSGKLSPQSFEQILKSGVRTKDVVTAGARGLFLKEVFYDE